ncbi:purine permease, partial [Proteus mirabilis]
NPKASEWGSVENIGLALMTLALVVCLNLSRHAAIRRLSILLAIVLGSVLAYLFGFGDFSKVATGTWIQVPSFFAFGL